MDVITMEATAYKELIRKIEKIADYVFKKESKPNEEEEIWLDNQEVANLLRISTGDFWCPPQGHSGFRQRPKSGRS